MGALLMELLALRLNQGEISLEQPGAFTRLFAWKQVLSIGLNRLSSTQPIIQAGVECFPGTSAGTISSRILRTLLIVFLSLKWLAVTHRFPPGRRLPPFHLQLIMEGTYKSNPT